VILQQKFKAVAAIVLGVLLVLQQIVLVVVDACIDIG
jgi:hypothetical protein